MGKYVMLTEGRICDEGKTLFRIRAERDIPSQKVKSGDLGGLIHDIKNLPQSGNAWISGEAQVLGNSSVGGNSLVGGYAIVKGDSDINGYTKVIGSAILEDVVVDGNNLEIRERAQLKNVTMVAENSLIHGFSVVENVGEGTNFHGLEIGGRAVITSSGQDIEITGSNIVVNGNALVEDVHSIKAENLLITGDAVVEKGVMINGKDIVIKDYAHVKGKLKIGDNFSISDVASLKRGLVDSPPFKDISIDGDSTLSTNAFEPPHDPFGGL